MTNTWTSWWPFLRASRLVTAIGDAYGVALLFHMLITTITLTLLAYQATKVINNLNKSQHERLTNSFLGQRSQCLCRHYHRLPALLTGSSVPLLHIWKSSHWRGKLMTSYYYPSREQSSNVFDGFSEFICNGGSLLLPLVRRLRGSQNFRPNCLSAVSESHVHIWGKVLHGVFRSFRFGNFHFLNISNFENNYFSKWIFHCVCVFFFNFVGTRCCCDVLHGIGAAEINWI